MLQLLARPAPVCAALLLLATGCSSAASQSSEEPRPAESSSTAGSPSPTAEPSADPKPQWRAEEAKLGTVRVGFRYDAARYRSAPDGRVHLLPLNVVTDSTAERWGDLFLLAPTAVYDRKQTERPLPADPVAWLRTHPRQEVLRERSLTVMGRPAVELAVDRDGALLFGDRNGGIEGDGIERFVLWQVDDTWMLLQAGTFLGRQGVLAPDKRDELVPQVLRSLEVVGS